MYRALLLTLNCLALTGCASLMNGTHQNIAIQSVPSEASVSVDGVQYGKTPVVANLKRGDAHFVQIDMPGFKTFQALLTRKWDGWAWGNIIYGGIPGLIVDEISGGINDLVPEKLVATLEAGEPLKGKAAEYMDREALNQALYSMRRGNKISVYTLKGHEVTGIFRKYENGLVDIDLPKPVSVDKATIRTVEVLAK